MSDVLLWTPTHGCTRVDRPARMDSGGCLEDLQGEMGDRNREREREREIIREIQAVIVTKMMTL